ncbi:Glu-tRNA(Gln) amidotransferase subunit GatD [Candidatus Pacearchaeota archaeon]|nr:Glu-tRNA(Gln) amidotransferase subunit GatD [Candidatus Pacearchaeota archaeon]
METKTFKPGDKVKIQTKSKTWEGLVLESHDSSIILLKLKSGYNIGIREGEILDAEVLAKAEGIKKEKPEIVVDSNLPNVALIITGGTISSRLDSKTGGVIGTDKDDILNIAPKLKEICNPIIVSPFMKMSEDMDPKDWIKIAEECEKYLNDESISGIIVTQGTDTLHYTASALSFFLRNLNKPIALTYSQRSVDRASTDASLNLVCAARYAVSEIAEVAIVGHRDSNDKVCLAMPATKTRKMHTSKRDAFHIINGEPIAEITKEKLIPLKDFDVRLLTKPKLDAKYSDKVALVRVYPGQDPSILEYYEKEGYRGIVLETTGLGHVPTKDSNNNWLPKIKKAILNGMTICAVAGTINGRLNPNVYSAGRDLQKSGIIYLKDMLAETALVKLGWVLAHKKWEVKEKMLENIADEYSPTLHN